MFAPVEKKGEEGCPASPSLIVMQSDWFTYAHRAGVPTQATAPQPLFNTWQVKYVEAPM